MFLHVFGVRTSQMWSLLATNINCAVVVVNAENAFHWHTILVHHVSTFVLILLDLSHCHSLEFF